MCQMQAIQTATVNAVKHKVYGELLHKIETNRKFYQFA